MTPRHARGLETRIAQARRASRETFALLRSMWADYTHLRPLALRPYQERLTFAWSIITGAILIAAVTVSLGAVYGIIAPAGTIDRGLSEPATATSPPETRPVPSIAPTPVQLRVYSLTDPGSPWFLVNKLRPIPGAATYEPGDLTTLPPNIPNPNGQSLRRAAAAAFVQLAAAAKAETGATLVAQSGYRSFKYQTDVYASYTKSDGGASNADATSARPGYSEHQTGMAVDILDTQSGCGLEDDCFGRSPTGVWLAANAYRYGWVLRYPPKKSMVTGFAYEPWHFRWVGTALASQLRDSGKQTLEELFGLAPAPNYSDQPEMTAH